MLESQATVAKEKWTLLLADLLSLKDERDKAKCLVESKEEASLIINQVTRLERRLERKEKRRIDFLKYVKYCVDLINLLKLRKKKIKVKKEKYRKIETSIIDAINQAFRIFIYRNQGDFDMWKSYIEFNKQKSSADMVSKIFLRLLKVASNKCETWIEAANWEYESSLKNFDNARSFFTQALKFFPANAELWKNFFKMELVYADKLRNDNNFASSQFSDNNKLLVMQEGALVEFLVKEMLDKNIDADCFAELVLEFDWFEKILDKFSLTPRCADLNKNNAQNAPCEKETESNEISKNCADENELIEYFKSCQQSQDMNNFKSSFTKFCVNLFNKAESDKTALENFLKAVCKIKSPEIYILTVHTLIDLKKFKIAMEFYTKQIENSCKAHQINLALLPILTNESVDKKSFSLAKKVCFSFIEGKYDVTCAEELLNIVAWVKRNSKLLPLNIIDRILSNCTSKLSESELNVFYKKLNFV